MRCATPLPPLADPGTALVGTASAQESKTALRLESVTWNPVDHKLTWAVAKGSLDPDGHFQEKQTTETSTYEINMDEATMMFNGAPRR